MSERRRTIARAGRSGGAIAMVRLRGAQARNMQRKENVNVAAIAFGPYGSRHRPTLGRALAAAFGRRLRSCLGDASLRTEPCDRSRQSAYRRRTAAAAMLVLLLGAPHTIARTTFPRATFPRATVPLTTLPLTTLPRTTLPRTTLPRTTVPRTTFSRTTCGRTAFVRGAATLPVAATSAQGPDAPRPAQVPQVPLAPQEVSGPRPALGPCHPLANGLQYRAVDVPSASHAAIVLALRVGAHHDPEGATGLAQVMAWWLGLAQEQRPAYERFAVVARGPYTMLFGVFPADSLRARLADLAAVLGGDVETEPDTVRLAIAKAKLAADDAANVLPGLALYQRAQRLLLAGTPSGRQSLGIPAQIDAVTADVVRARYARYYRPRNAVLAVVGAIGEADASDDGARGGGEGRGGGAGRGGGEGRGGGADGRGGEGLAADPAANSVPDARGDALVREVFGGLAAGPEPAPTPTVHDAAPPFEPEATHAHAGAAFVSVALVAPPPDAGDFAAFLIAAHTLQLRAYETFGAFRGRELQAMFPYLDYDFRSGQRVLMLNRRGRDGESAEGPRGELRYVLERLRSEGPTPQEIARATGQVIEAVTLPPYGDLDELARQPPRLLMRAQGIVLAQLGVLPPNLRQDVSRTLVDHVQKALARYLAADRLTWLALLPGG